MNGLPGKTLGMHRKTVMEKTTNAPGIAARKVRQTTRTYAAFGTARNGIFSPPCCFPRVYSCFWRATKSAGAGNATIMHTAGTMEFPGLTGKKSRKPFSDFVEPLSATANLIRFFVAVAGFRDVRYMTTTWMTSPGSPRMGRKWLRETGRRDTPSRLESF